MFNSLKLPFISIDSYPTGVSLALGKTIHFSNLEFTVDHLCHLSLSSKEWDSDTIFIGMVHSGSPSLHTALEDSSDEDGAASGAGGSSRSPGPRECNVVTPTVPNTTTPASENTPTLQTIPTVTVWTATPQPRMELLPIQHQAYQEEQQARVRTQQIDVELRVAQRHDKLVDEQAALDAQLTELHQRKAALGTERAITIDFTKAQAWVRAIATTINREGMPHPTFARASQNVATAATLLDTLPTSSTDGVCKVYHQMKDILGVAAEQQAESSLQRRA
jgi:hypothetical protein